MARQKIKKLGQTTPLSCCEARNNVAVTSTRCADATFSLSTWNNDNWSFEKSSLWKKCSKKSLFVCLSQNKVFVWMKGLNTFKNIHILLQVLRCPMFIPARRLPHTSSVRAPPSPRYIFGVEFLGRRQKDGRRGGTA